MNLNFFRPKNVKQFVCDDHQKTLSPTTIKDDHQRKTVLNLARRLQEEDALNIALTGPYGSGKSSILRALMLDLGIAKLHFEIGAGKENFEWETPKHRASGFQSK